MTYHEKDMFRKKLSEILGLPSTSSAKNGREVYSWHKNNCYFDVLLYNNQIIVYKVLLVDLTTYADTSTDKAIQLAQNFIEELEENGSKDD